MKTYVITETMKNAKEYFKGKMVLQGLYNDKPAVYISAEYSNEEMEEMIDVFSAKPGNRYMGNFVALKLVQMSEAKGKVLIAK